MTLLGEQLLLLPMQALQVQVFLQRQFCRPKKANLFRLLELDFYYWLPVKYRNQTKANFLPNGKT